jgi:hypothetical protein
MTWSDINFGNTVLYLSRRSLGFGSSCPPHTAVLPTSITRFVWAYHFNAEFVQYRNSSFSARIASWLNPDTQDEMQFSFQDITALIRSFYLSPQEILHD